jgi:hypothetical protein
MWTKVLVNFTLYFSYPWCFFRGCLHLWFLEQSLVLPIGWKLIFWLISLKCVERRFQLMYNKKLDLFLDCMQIENEIVHKIRHGIVLCRLALKQFKCITHWSIYLSLQQKVKCQTYFIKFVQITSFSLHPPWLLPYRHCQNHWDGIHQI